MNKGFSDRKKNYVNFGYSETRRVAHSHLADCQSLWIAELSTEAQSAIITFVSDHEDLFLRIFIYCCSKKEKNSMEPTVFRRNFRGLSPELYANPRLLLIVKE